MPMKMCYIDVECGSLDKQKGALLQMAGMIVINGLELETFDYFIKPFPDDEVLDEALELNHITREQIESDPKFLEPMVAYKKFTKLLLKYVNKFDKKDKYFFIGYNSHAFDSPFIRNWFAKCGDKFYGSYFFHPSIDVMLIGAYKLMKKRTEIPNFKLASLAEYLGITIKEEEMHNALTDIRVTRDILLKLWTV